MTGNLLALLQERLHRWMQSQGSEVYERSRVHIVLENSRPDIDSASVLERLDEALALLEQHAPQRLRHFRRDVRQILIARYPCRGAYFSAERTCLTELTFLARRDIPASVVASSILHEGVHARVDRFRARFGTPLVARSAADLAREERLCRKAEVAFGLSLPAPLGDAVLQRARNALTLDDEGVAPTIDWGVAQARISDIDRRDGA
jgi:hypothetical protein